MLNKVVLQGRMVRDPEVKQTQSGFSVSEFTVAWSEKVKEVETKCFLRVKAWRQTADFIGKYFKKGQEILVEGHLVTEEWEKDGQKQSRTICVADKIHFCGSKGSGATAATTEADADGFMNIPDNEAEELPFI